MDRRSLLLLTVIALGCSGREPEPAKTSKELFAEAEAAQRREQAHEKPDTQINPEIEPEDPAEKHRFRLIRAWGANRPSVESGLSKLLITEKYFDDPELVWAEFSKTASDLSRKGFKADPNEILDGTLAIMFNQKIDMNGKVSIRNFMFVYQGTRESVFYKGEIRPTTHDEAVEYLSKYRKFYVNP